MTYLLTYFLDVLQLYDTLHEAFERLSRVAVFIKEAALGERQAVDENVSFEAELQLLEDSHDAGLYWLLCALRRAIHADTVSVSTTTTTNTMHYHIHYQ